MVVYLFYKTYFRCEPPENVFYQNTDGRIEISMSILPRITSFSLTGHRNLRKTQQLLTITGAVNSHRILCTIIFIWAPYGEFYFSNFDFAYLNKYCMKFNSVKCITKYEPLATTYYNSSSSNVCWRCVI